MSSSSKAGRGAEAGQSCTEPWEGNRGESGVSKETNASSVRRTQRDPGKERARQGGSNLGKWLGRRPLGPKREMLMRKEMTAAKSDRRGPRQHSPRQPHQSLCILWPSKPGEHRKRDEKVGFPFTSNDRNLNLPSPLKTKDFKPLMS